MLRTILTTTAVAALFATGAVAQTATDEAPADPVIVEEGAAEAEGGPTTDPLAPETAEDPAMTTEEPAVAEDPATTTEEPAVAEDPATTTEEPAVAEDPAMTTEDPAMAEDPAMGAEDPAMAEDPATTTTTTTAAPVEGDDPAMAAGEEGWTPVEVGSLTAEDLMGAEIRNVEGEDLATVDDVVLSTDGQIDGLAAKFGGFLGFGSNTVLLSMDEVEIGRDASDNLVLRTNMTPEELEGRPDYEAPAEAEG